ncbi:MAG: calcium/sodium antiporter [archaeon]
MIEYLLLLLGIIFLVKGADFLIEGSSSLAHRLNIPTIIIGLTIVAFGTSMPELFVSLIGAARGETEIIFGNIIGSNISNILLILGLTAFVHNIQVKRDTIWKEIPFALLGSVILLIVANKTLLDKVTTSTLLRIDGIFLLLFLAIFIYYVYESAKRHRNHLKEKTIQIKERKTSLSLLLILVGLVGLYFGGEWTIKSAVTIAKQFGLSDFLIAATVIAIGTSLPELVTSIRAAQKHEIGLAIGNIVGSNIFNIFWILGITSVIAPLAIPSFINADIIILIAATFLLFLFVFMRKDHTLTRIEGTIFILSYIAYIIFLIVRG